MPLSRGCGELKKLTSILLAAVMIAVAVLVSGCGAEKESGKVKVVSTLFPAYDFAGQIGGARVDTVMLLDPGTDSHYYEMTLADIAAVQSCDIFIYNGGDSDAWAEDILSAIDRDDLTVLRLMDHVDLLTEDEGVVALHGHEGHDHEDHHHDEEYDEHVWTSPKNAALMCLAVEECLAEFDPAGAQAYRAATEEYVKELAALDCELRDIAAAGAGKTLVFADRFPFLYLTHEYGFDVRAAFSGCSAEAELSLATVAELTNTVMENNVPVIFRIEFSSGGAAESIARKTGAALLRLHSCHNVSKKDFENGVTYLDLMRQNAANLREALS